MTTCLVTYDIANPKRLRRMHRALRKIAAPIQYSVFLGEFTPAGRAALRALIEGIIDPREDDVRIYPLPADGWQRRLGRASLPGGITLTMLPPAFRTSAGAEGAAASPLAPAAKTPAASAPGRAARQHQRLAQTGQRSGIQLIR